MSYKVVAINRAKGVVTLGPVTEEVAEMWQDAFHDKILPGGSCPVCAGQIRQVDSVGYSWKCEVAPSERYGYPRYGSMKTSHTGLDFIRVMYPKRGWGWIDKEKEEKVETENEFGPICP